MIRSMTGFGQAERTAAGWRCTVELRSVNGRYLDLRLRLPNGLAHLDEPLKKRIKAVCERGKLDGTVTLAPAEDSRPTLALNRPLLEAYAALVREASAVLEQPVRVSLSDLVNNRELVQTQSWESQGDTARELVEGAVDDALANLVAMREHEGAALRAALEGHTGTLRKAIAEVRPLLADLPAQYGARLRENLARLGEGSVPNEDRILQEIALFADRADVTEEFARLDAHLDHVDALLKDGGPVGRKFEFLLQELNRETNTLGVKANEPRVSAIVVEMKSEIEKLREQIQNIE